jgi:hypothetical protein
MHLRSLLPVPLLASAAFAQYAGEGPTKVVAPANNPRLGATALGVAQVQQILLVPHASLGSNVYYCAATVIRTGQSQSDLQTGTFDANTGTYTRNTDIDARNTAGSEFALGISDDLRVAVWDDPAGVRYATRAGTTGAFGATQVVNGITGAYVDPNFGRINGQLVIFWASSATTISAGNFDPATGNVTSVRVVARRTGTTGFPHSPTPMNDASGATRGLVFCETSGLWVTMTPGVDGNTPNYQFLQNGTNWLANGDANGGTITVAQAPSATYGDPLQTGVAALTGCTIPATGGTINLTMYMPSKSSGTPYQGVVLLGTLGTAGITIGGAVVGKLSLSLSGFMILPPLTLPNVDGAASYNFPVGAFPTGTKVAAQAALVDFAGPSIYLSNTAQIQVQ